jgi:hypothetical protein
MRGRKLAPSQDSLQGNPLSGAAGQGETVSAVMAEGRHPVPFRTRKLSPPAPMVLPWRRGGRVGRRRDILNRSPRKGAPVVSRIECPPDE